MKAYHRIHRLLAMVLALVMVFSMLPAGVLAAGVTLPGSPEAVQVGLDSAAQRENSFNMGWKFYLGDNSSASSKNFDDSAWENVNIPHDFSITQNFTSTGEAESGFLPGGTGWYRKHFVLDTVHENKSFLLNFDGVYMHAYVYVNGTFVGEHHFGYTAFAFDITDHLICDGVTENVIAVKAVNQTPSSRWYSGSGIYRDVTLYALDPVHVDLNGITVTTPEISSGSGKTNVKTTLVNDSVNTVSATVTYQIKEKGSSAVLATASAAVTVPAGATAEAAAAPVVSSPKLWSVESSSLYTLTAEVTVNGQVVDTCSTEFGYRWFGFSSNGFQLNGQNVKLNGVCMHHDQGALGSAAYYDAMYRQMSIMKDMGCNAIRTAHNPADEDLIAICNELGVLVIEETFDGLIDPKNGNSYDFSRYFEQTASSGLYGFKSGMTCAEYAARSMVKRDKNAPAIFAWSFGNEIQEGTSNWKHQDGTYSANVQRYDELCADYIGWVNAEDGSRPVTSGCNNRGNDQPLVDVINTILNADGIAGFNYANVISGNSDRDLSMLATRFAGSTGAIIASETASHTNSRGQYKNQNNNSNSDGKYHLTSYDTSAVGWGITAHDSIYNTYSLDNVAGEFVWTGFDYIGEPTPWNGTGTGDSGRGAIPNSSYFGIVETTGFAKDSYWLYRAQWNKNDTTVHLVTAWDADNQYITGGKTPVWVYTNAAKVELYLNNDLIGTTVRTPVISNAGHTYYTYKATSNDSRCTAADNTGADALYSIFNVAYTAGTLTAKAYDEAGNEIDLDKTNGQYTVKTPDTVTQLKASVNKTQIAADGQSLAYVTVDVLDANGNLDTTATNNLTFTLSGPGEIAGVDNGDQATVNKYQNPYVLTNRQNANINAYAGKALVIVRSTEDAGQITLNIASSGLTGQTVTINTSSSDESTVEGLVSYEMIRDYTVKIGTVPTLNTTAKGTMSNGSTVSGTITWDTIPSGIYSNAGDYTIYGTLNLAGLEPVRVSALLHVIPNIIDLRNVSAATAVNTAPALPTTVRGVLADGTLSGEFVVEWERIPSADEFATLDTFVTVTGTAVIFGEETMDVTCTVRSVQPIRGEASNVAIAASSVEEDIPKASWSDNRNSIIDGVRSPSGDSTNDRWTNWNYRNTRDTAAITLKWDTAQIVSDINLFYRYDGTCQKPSKIVISYSLDGNTFTDISHTESAIDMSVNHGAGFTYVLAQTINPIAIRVTLTQQSGKCLGLYEIEAINYKTTMEPNTSANLSGISVDNTPVEGFSADTLEYVIGGTTVTATTAVNAGITILPAYEGVVRILTVSEDGSAAKTYEVTVSEACDHSSTEIQGASDATCTDDGYTGDTYCTNCGIQTATGTVIPSTGHSYGDWIGSEPTCTTNGVKTSTCTLCGDAKTETIPATGHLHTEVRNAVSAGCESTGYSGDTWCTDCDTMISTGTTIAAKGHKWDAGVVTQQPTASADGEKTFTCSTCGTTKTEPVKYQATLKAPSVSLKLSKTSAGKITVIGQVNDYANLDDYYEITAHGLVYIQSSKIGTRTLNVNTSGRTKVNCTGYNADGSFSYSFKPTSKSTAYTYRAYITYRNTVTGQVVTVYSTIMRSSYNGISG